MKVLEGILIEDYDVNSNNYPYSKGQIIEVIEFATFNSDYGIFYNLEECNIIDWIPKKLIQII